MNIKDLIAQDETKTIKTVWYNMGTRTVDFNGTLKDCLKEWQIKVSTVKHPTVASCIGYRFKVAVGSDKFTIDKFSTGFYNGAVDVLKLLLTQMGDKAKIYTESREIRINH